MFIKPADIEAESMRIIRAELSEKGIDIPAENLPVVLRVIHTTADFDYASNLVITSGAFQRSCEKLKNGAVIVTDTTMALSGISKPALNALNCSAVCYVADPDVASAAKEAGITRSAVAVHKAAGTFEDAVFAVGNAPTALIALSEKMRLGYRPALVVAVPVGFVNVVEAKEEILSLCREYDVPAVVALGRKGGSNVAASICNALLYSASGKLDPHARF